MPRPDPRPENTHHSLLKRKEEFIPKLETGKIKIKPDIQRIDGNTVIFTDGSFLERIDAIILCTGYSMSFSFIDDEALVPGLKEKRLDLYKKIIHPLYPTLAFIAQVDAIGSIFSISEMQARWVTKVAVDQTRSYTHYSKSFHQLLAKQLALPSQAEMLADVEKNKQKLAALKPKFPMFITYASYLDDLAQHIGCLPTKQTHLYQGRVSEAC